MKTPNLGVHETGSRPRGDETLSFGRAIREGRERLDHRHPTSRPWRVYSYVERGLYNVQVERALTHFPANQLLFLRSEDLRNNHHETLKQIADFLEIKPFPNKGQKAEHTRAAYEAEPRWTKSDLDLVAEIVEKDMKSFAEITNLSIDHWPVIMQSRGQI